MVMYELAFHACEAVISIVREGATHASFVIAPWRLSKLALKDAYSTTRMGDPFENIYSSPRKGPLNSECTRSVLRKLNARQPRCPIRSIVATQTSQRNLLKWVVDAIRWAVRLPVSIGRHTKPLSKASPKCLLKAAGEIRVAITNQLLGQSA
jgi:hypothetical protein